MIAAVSLEPTTSYLRLDDRSTLTECRSDDRFSITLVESTGPLPNPVRMSSSVPALLVSLPLEPLAAPHFRLSIDGEILATRRIPAFHAIVVDLAAKPCLWAGSSIRFVHFHVRRSSIDEIATDLGYERAEWYRLAVVELDILLAQIARSVVPQLTGARGPHPIALDHLELILGAHLLQRYAGVRQRRERGRR